MKKESQVVKAIKLLKAEPNISAQDMAKQMGIPVKRVYVLRNNVKNAIAKDAANVRPKLRMQTTTAEYTLEEENKKLTEWTLLWKQKYDKLEQDYTQAKIMYLDSQAVVKYLEEKVLKLVRGE